MHSNSFFSRQPSNLTRVSPPTRGEPTGPPLPPLSRIAVDAVSVARLLSEVSLVAAPSQVVALRGANGSGKTTLLKVLAGRITPTTGTAFINERRVNERDSQFRRDVAAMIGLPPFAPDLTVVDHITLVASTWHGTPKAIDQAVTQALTEFDLSQLQLRYPHELSSGQTQLLGLALTFARPCDVLLLDEPEQRLDPHRIELVGRAIAARREGGTTIVAATHSASLAALTADITLTLEDPA